MASTYNVTTWDELASAFRTCLNNNYSWDGSVINIMNDIDLNNEHPEGVSMVFTSYSQYALGTLTINGNGHKIKNLRTPITSPTAIIDIDSPYTGLPAITLVMKNIDFQNIILAGANFISLHMSYSSAGSDFNIYMNNCRFVGSRSGNAYLWSPPTIDSRWSLNLTSCFFNIPWIGAGSSSLGLTSLVPKCEDNYSGDIYVTANYCYFREKYTNWSWPTDTYYDYSAGGPRFFSFSYIKINGCYIDGDAQVPVMRTYESYGAFYCPFLHRAVVSHYTPSTQNVFNVTITATTVNYPYFDFSSDGRIHYSSLYGLVCKNASRDGSLVNWTDASKTSFDDSSSYPSPILATIEQMHDAQALQALGFDIVIPD